MKRMVAITMKVDSALRDITRSSIEDTEQGLVRLGEYKITLSTTYPDTLGSTIMTLDTAGEIVWSVEYAAFGRYGMEAGVEEELGRFTGKALDPDTGLYYFNARWYDSEIGRFTSEGTATPSVSLDTGASPAVEEKEGECY